MRKINKILIGTILIAVMFLGIGYSAIQNITLDITGSATAELVMPSTEYTTPYLPTGFSKVEGTDLDTGFAIQDGLGNQYVWVIVPRSTTVYNGAGLDLNLDSLTGNSLTNAYNNIETDLKEYCIDYRLDGYSDTHSGNNESTGLTSTQYTNLKRNMLKSVYKYGGFYIGRYEAGIANSYRDYGTAYTTVHSTSETAVLQANAYPYTWLTCSQAQSLASGMPSGEYTSSLMFGIQWDLALKYLETTGVSQPLLNSNSTSWGNYINSTYSLANASAKYNVYNLSTGLITEWLPATSYSKAENVVTLLTTGTSDTFSKQGIYDLAGNMFEWTLEYSSDSSRPSVVRGGACNCNGSVDSADARYTCPTSYSLPNIAFRASIF